MCVAEKHLEEQSQTAKMVLALKGYFDRHRACTPEEARAFLEGAGFFPAEEERRMFENEMAHLERAGDSESDLFLYERVFVLLWPSQSRSPCRSSGVFQSEAIWG